MKGTARRKAALELHSLHPMDRRWILSRLPRVEQKHMKMLMKQIPSFTGIDLAMLREELFPKEAAVPVELPAPVSLIAVLDELSPPWAARVLRAVASDHENFYLSNCNQSRKLQVEDALALLPESLPPAMVDALGRYVAERGQIVPVGASA